jgi:hypothetical protein
MLETLSFLLLQEGTQPAAEQPKTIGVEDYRHDKERDAP